VKFEGPRKISELLKTNSTLTSLNVGCDEHKHMKK